MQFRKPLLSYKGTACARLADHIAEAAQAMGLEASTDKSRQSASQYVYVHDVADEECERDLKIRCSDHSDKHGGSDWQVWDDECPSATIARVAAHYGREVPAGYRAGDYARRAEAAAKAAATRGNAKWGAEQNMRNDVIAALRNEKDASRVGAGRIIDRLFPGVPRAQRQRMAEHASYVVKSERARADEFKAVEKANGNLEKLLAIAERKKSVAARDAIRALVAQDEFSRMKPANWFKSQWNKAP